MCLAVPMKLVEVINPKTGITEMDGVRCEVNISLLESLAVGDYLIVHAGFAIAKMNEAEAMEQISLLNSFLTLDQNTGSN